VVWGKFQSANKVVTIALQVLERQQRDYQAWVEEIREKVNEAAQSLEQGKKIPSEVVTDRIQAKFREAHEAQG
jgi:antitoxin ParD1/3/4